MMRDDSIRCAQIVGLLCLSFATLPSPGLAQSDEDFAAITARIDDVDSEIAVSFDIANAFTEDFRRRLGGGLTSRSVIGIELRDRAGRIVLSHTRVCEFRLDIWKDELVVRLTDGSKSSSHTVLLTDQGLAICGRLDRVAIGSRALLADADAYRLYVTIEQNPISAEVLERTRAFTANPRSASRSESRTFFGAIARLFRSDADNDGEMFHFRSQLLARPEARPR